MEPVPSRYPTPSGFYRLERPGPLAVREYVRAIDDGGDERVDDIELTMDHFEAALDEVDPERGLTDDEVPELPPEPA